MLSEKELDILDILSQDARLTADKIAVMTGLDVQSVEKAIKKLEDDRVILKYPAMIN